MTTRRQWLPNELDWGKFQLHTPNEWIKHAKAADPTEQTVVLPWLKGGYLSIPVEEFHHMGDMHQIYRALATIAFMSIGHEALLMGIEVPQEV